MYKRVLTEADGLPERVRNFLLDYTKTCNGCRYCVQTDKTGTRPLAAIAFDKGKKCPLFPGFSMNWRKLSQELSDHILETLDAIDNLLK